MNRGNSLDLSNRDHFKSEGVPLVAKSDLGFMNYRTMIRMKKHVESDPAMPCRNYDDNFSYTDCQEQRYIRQTTQLLGCVPPWLSSNSSLWCRHSFRDVEGNPSFKLKCLLILCKE